MESRVAVGDPDHVPVGKYARAALEGLDLWEDVPPRLLRAADAPSAARLFEMGEADALIAYATDLSPGSGDVYVAPFPPASMPRVVYPLALCVNANSGAELFAEYLKSAEAARVFERHGFAAPHGEATASRAQAGPPVPPSSAPRSPLLQTIGVSLRVSTLAMVLMLGPGLAVGWALARLRFPGKTLVEAAVMLPLVLPPVVTGFLLLETLGQASPLGAWMETRLGLSLAFHQTGAALAAAVMGFPLLARSARAAFESVDPRFEEVAATLGDGPLRRFLKVSLPLAGPGVLAGCVLGFARALGEFGATITFAGNMAGETRTLPLAIYNEMQRPGSDANTRPLVLACAAISVAALVLSQFFVARSRARRKERAT
jgi:molybdate transport system permease protein